MDDKTAAEHLRDQRARFNAAYYRHADATTEALEIDEAYQLAVSALEALAKIREIMKGVPDGRYICTPPAMADAYVAIGCLVLDRAKVKL